MHKDYSNVDPRVLGNEEAVISNHIETLRNQGYTDDDIFLALIEARCNPNPNSGKNVSKQNEKTKKYVYKSDIFKKK